MKDDFVKTTEKRNRSTYKNAIFDKDGWADAEKSSPIPFDLVTVETKTKKNIKAWWGEGDWFGYRLKKTDEIIRWKKFKYEHLVT